jgi:hypothetical protein
MYEGNMKGGEHWEDLGEDIRVYLSEVGWEGVDWMQVAQDRGQWRGIS